MPESDQAAPTGRQFARKFLAENRGGVAYLAFSQVAVIVYAAQERWGWCALWVAWVARNVWTLLRRAAGLPDPVSRHRDREDMTPKEAFWLDPSAVFDRKARRVRE